MTRKRFVKLMMALGYSRNEAQKLAAEVWRYGSYRSMYGFMSMIPRCLPKIWRGLAAACDAVAAVFARLGNSFRTLI